LAASTLWKAPPWALASFPGGWNAFRRFVIARVKMEDTAEIVTAARQTFQNLFEWLGTPENTAVIRSAN
jgi:hypothetical protein